MPGKQLRTRANNYCWRKTGDATPSWLRVRDDSLIPQLEADTLPNRRAELAAWIRQVDQYEFCQDIRNSTPSDPSVDSELHRVIRHAFQLFADGDISGGRTELEAVEEIIRDNPEYSFLAEFVTATLKDWGDEQNIAGRRDFVRTTCERATTLAAQHNSVRAASILRSTIELYKQDPTVEQELAECNRLLTRLESAEQDKPTQAGTVRPVP